MSSKRSTVEGRRSIHGPRRLVLAALAAVLVAAIGLIVYGETRPLERTFYGSVKDLLPTPKDLPGWNVRYLPLADTPEAETKVAEALQYDDAVFAVYTCGAERISVYIAYWQPGKMSPRLVAGHTPDVCWVNAGWKPVESEQRTEGGEQKAEGKGQKTEGGEQRAEGGGQGAAYGTIVRKIASQVAGIAETPGQYRVFEREGRTEHMVFWHEVGGRVVGYGEGPLPAWYASITDLFRWGFAQRQEQFFVRVSGPQRVAFNARTLASRLSSGLLRPLTA